MFEADRRRGGEMISSGWGTAFGAASRSAMQAYQDALVGSLFEPWARLLVDIVGVAPAQAVLDVACGPGTVTRLAAAAVGPSGRVTGCDLSRAMLDVAEAKPPVAACPLIEYREEPADRLSVDDADFDVVLCQQGLQFFPDRPAALAQMYRALRPGGRLGIAVWTGIEDAPAFEALAGAVGDVCGDQLAARYRAGPWGLPDAAQIAALVRDACFRDVRVERHVMSCVFPGGPEQLSASLAASGIAAELQQLGDQERSDLLEALKGRVSGLVTDGVVRSDNATTITVAIR